jgi:hypothetical protein
VGLAFVLHAWKYLGPGYTNLVSLSPGGLSPQPSLVTVSLVTKPYDEERLRAWSIPFLLQKRSRNDRSSCICRRVALLIARWFRHRIGQTESVRGGGTRSRIGRRGADRGLLVLGMVTDVRRNEMTAIQLIDADRLTRPSGNAGDLLFQDARFCRQPCLARQRALVRRR